MKVQIELTDASMLLLAKIARSFGLPGPFEALHLVLQTLSHSSTWYQEHLAHSATRNVN